MDKPLSRLKSIANKKELRTYEELHKYVHSYCGKTLMKAVEQYEERLRLFFEAKEFGIPKINTYRKPHHRIPPRLSAKK